MPQQWQQVYIPWLPWVTWNMSGCLCLFRVTQGSHRKFTCCSWCGTFCDNTISICHKNASTVTACILSMASLGDTEHVGCLCLFRVTQGSHGKCNLLRCCGHFCVKLHQCKWASRIYPIGVEHLTIPNWKRRLQALTTHIRLAIKNLSGTTALAYFDPPLVTKKKVLWSWPLGSML